MAWAEMNGDSAPLREGSFSLHYVPRPGSQEDPAMSVTVTLEIRDLLKSIPDISACGFYKTAFIQGSRMFSISNQMGEAAGMERAVTAGRRLGPLEREVRRGLQRMSAYRRPNLPRHFSKSPLPLPHNDKPRGQRGQYPVCLYCKDHQSIIILMKP